MLFLVATPIGNLADITLRALETLKSCDYILCEDTQYSQNLLKHYNINKPLKSYHKFNEAFQSEKIIQDLKDGLNIALISDAGTPGISDPGSIIVKLCIDQNIPLTAIPGPCAAIQAISCSGLSTEKFQFVGFLPKKEGELKRELQKILSYEGSTITYESPHRILSVLKIILEIAPERQLVIGRELTKKFEEIIRGTASEIISHFDKTQVKGEMVLLFSEPREDSQKEWEKMTPEEHVKFIQETYQLNKKEAIKIVAELRGVPKREVYKLTTNHL